MFRSASINVQNLKRRWKRIDILLPESIQPLPLPQDPDCPIQVVLFLSKSHYTLLSTKTDCNVHITHNAALIYTPTDHLTPALTPQAFALLYGLCNVIVVDGSAASLLEHLLTTFALPARRLLRNSPPPTLLVIGKNQFELFGLKPYFEEILFSADLLRGIRQALVPVSDYNPTISCNSSPPVTVEEWPLLVALSTNFSNRRSERLDVWRCRLFVRALAAIPSRRYLAWVEAVASEIITCAKNSNEHTSDDVIKFFARVAALQGKEGDIPAMVRMMRRLLPCEECGTVKFAHGDFHVYPEFDKQPKKGGFFNKFYREVVQGVGLADSIETAIRSEIPKHFNRGVDKTSIVKVIDATGDLKDLKPRFSCSPSAGPLCCVCGSFDDTHFRVEDFLAQAISRKLRICEFCDAVVRKSADMGKTKSKTSKKEILSGAGKAAVVMSAPTISEENWGCLGCLLCGSQDALCVLRPCSHLACRMCLDVWIKETNNQFKLIASAGVIPPTGTLLGRADVAQVEAARPESDLVVFRCPGCREDVTDAVDVSDLITQGFTRDGVVAWTHALDSFM